MIKGIGIDIVDIERIRDIIKKYGYRFLKRTFTGREIEYCRSKVRPEQHYAGRFAAKEAFIKASGAVMPLNGIEIEPAGKKPPRIKICGETQNRFRDSDIFLSITHDHDYAAAEVIVADREN